MEGPKADSNPFLADVELSNQSLKNNIITSTLYSSSHPVACIFHMVFKLAAIFIYLFCYFFTSSFVLSFVFIIICLACDFWTVKNVSGRLLVGLRWWNIMDENGHSGWHYEYTSTPDLINVSDSRIFWTCQVIAAICWILFFLMSLLKMNLNWLIVTVIGFLFTGTNLYLYYKAARASKTKVSAFNIIPASLAQKAAQGLGSVVMKAAASYTQTENKA
ncbi:hypothetical protein WA158_002106 [Blastocystis sp. Blastoise]